MRSNKSSNKPQRKSQTSGTKDWLLFGGGAIVVIALVVFVLTRKSPTVTPPAAVRSTTAQAATSGVGQQEHDETASVRRVTTADLRSAMDRGEVMVIDVRDLDSYKAGHIAGAYQIPLSVIENEIQYLPRGKMIVTYCT